MGNPCGTTKANIFESTKINGTPIYFGSGVSPVNSPAQYFVAWGKGVLAGGLIHTFNSQSPKRDQSGLLRKMKRWANILRYRSYSQTERKSLLSRVNTYSLKGNK